MTTRLAALLAVLLAACDPSPVSQGSGGGTTCTSAASDSCSADQPSLVTCPSSVAFDAGALNCTRSYVNEDPGVLAYCCGTCTFTAGSSCRDGGGQLVTCPAATFATTGCDTLFDGGTAPDGGYAWCCPPEPD